MWLLICACMYGCGDEGEEMRGEICVLIEKASRHVIHIRMKPVLFFFLFVFFCLCKGEEGEMRVWMCDGGCVGMWKAKEQKGGGTIGWV